MRPVVLFALVCTAPAALAQYQPYNRRAAPALPENLIGSKQFDISGWAGWQTNGDVGTSGGNLAVDDAQDYGAALDYRVSSFGAVELAWQYTKPNATFFSTFYPATRPFAVSSHYFQLGGLTEKRLERAEFFLGLTLGAAVFTPDGMQTTNGTAINTSDTWRFATTLFLGSKIWITDNIGVRLEVRMLTPILFNGGGFYFGTGGGGMAVSAGIPSVQFAFNGGLCFGK